MAKKNEITEERRFTLRLTDVESHAIEDLKLIVKETTDSAVVRYIIKNYNSLHKAYEAEKKKNYRLEQKMNEQTEDLETLFSTLDRLNPNKKKNE
jgi:hypothetical protein